MTTTYHTEIEQGTPEWHEIRCGVITASAIKHMLTATGKIANNETSRRVVAEIASERLSGYSEETATTFAMVRGHDDEELAREVYTANVAPVDECGFITNDEYGFVIGCSPDGLIGDDGGWECKSRLHAIQLQTIIDGTVPDEFMAQIQTCLLVSGRKWWDFCSTPSYGGSKALLVRVLPDPVWHARLIEAATECERRVQELIEAYQKAVDSPNVRLLDIPRRENEPTDEVKV